MVVVASSVQQGASRQPQTRGAAMAAAVHESSVSESYLPAVVSGRWTHRCLQSDRKPSLVEEEACFCSSKESEFSEES